MADVFTIAPQVGVLARDGRQVGSYVLDRLHPRLLIATQHRVQLRGSAQLVPDLDLLVDVQHLFHLASKLGIALLQPQPHGIAILL